jgi:hypothetical protein
MVEMPHEPHGSNKSKSVDFYWGQLNLQPQRGCQQCSTLRDDIIDQH